MKLAEILAVLCHLAPEKTALPGDPIGLLLGDFNTQVEITRIGVCLDATPDVTGHAVSSGVQLVLAHHPLIYQPLKSLGADPISRAVITLVKADIALYAMHTNWDRAAGGINDTLAALLELENVHPLGADGEAALPRVGDLASPRPLADFARFVEEAFEGGRTNKLRVNALDPSQMISRVAVCGGAGAGLSAQVQAAGAEAYVTSDVRHHEFLDATGRGLALLDAGHEATEEPGMRTLVHSLPELLPGVEVAWIG